MHSRFPTGLRRAAAAAVALVAAVPALTSTASAHETPKAGTRCPMSGATMIDHGHVQVCLTNAAGKATWGPEKKVSKSSLTLSDGWVKAADSGMTAAFGTLKNPTNKPINVVAVSTPYSPTQLHEVVMKDDAMVMQQKKGGFVIPAGGSIELKPGGNHVMFMKLAKPVTAGSMVPITFVTSDGGLATVKVMGKVFTGANETYNGSSDSSGMNMG